MYGAVEKTFHPFELCSRSVDGTYTRENTLDRVTRRSEISKMENRDVVATWSEFSKLPDHALGREVNHVGVMFTRESIRATATFMKRFRSDVSPFHSVC